MTKLYNRQDCLFWQCSAALMINLKGFSNLAENFDAKVKFNTYLKYLIVKSHNENIDEPKARNIINFCLQATRKVGYDKEQLAYKKVSLISRHLSANKNPNNLL